MKPSLRLWSLMTGCGHSTPMSDHVPELKYAQSPPLAGTAATAAPVSCEQVATTSICGRPTSVARFFFMGPSLAPDGQMGANKSSRRPSAVNNLSDQPLWTGS